MTALSATTEPTTSLSPNWRVLPLVPAVLAVISWVVEGVLNQSAQVLHQSVALTCAAICVVLLATPRNRVAGRVWLWAIVAAMVLSVVGDLFLTNRTTDTGFIAGIGFFLLAHIGFLTYALKRVRFNWVVLVVIAIPLLVLYFVFFLPPLRTSPALAVAVLAYLLISCFSLAATIDLSSRSAARWVYAAGILSLVISDAFIAFDDFAGMHAVSPLIMPLYYLCHVLVVVSVTIEFSRAPAGDISIAAR